MHHPKLVIFLFLLLMPFYAIAESDILLSQCSDHCGLPFPLQVYEDIESTAQYASLQNNLLFKNVFDRKPNYGPSNSDFWIRFSINNDTSTDKVLWLELNPYVIDATLFSSSATSNSRTKSTANEIETQVTGARYSLQERGIRHVKPILRLSIKANQKKSYYLRFRSVVSVMDFTFWNVERFAESESTNQYLFGMWYGLMLVMIIYNLFLFTSIKDKSYLYYCLYLIGIVLNQMGISGHALYIAPPQTASLFTETFGIFYAFWAVQFVKSFLHTHKSQKANLLLNTLAAALIVPLYFLLSANHKLCIVSMNIIGIVIVISVATIGIQSFRKGFKPARFFVLAWSFLLVGVLIFIVRGLGYIPSNLITENSARIGAAIEVILLSIALADRINQFKRERQQEIELRLLALEKVERMHEVFEKFVPHQFIELLQKDDLLSLKPGDHIQRTMTILFSDIRAFTELSESMTPTENFKFINSYLSRMEPHIQQNNGFIDKFIGDAIMALFDESPDDAVNAGVSMIKSLDIYNEHRASSGYRALSIGIGINTGKLILGTVGDNTRMDSTVISDAVNLASRIEGLCKTYGVSLLISHETYVSLTNPEQFNCRLLDIVKTKGKQQETIIYEVIDADTDKSAELKAASMENFNNAISYFQAKDFEKALHLFGDIITLHPNDNPAIVYSTRCQEEIERTR
ncbi:hypothetical protein A9Q81_01190 [Gammaproteobacteria bacterium 42_54_T18]|nr:hypothetical protein A9Q81_01190 [Gammaproteobacteria bacterium 42_54_T18]